MDINSVINFEHFIFLKDIKIVSFNSIIFKNDQFPKRKLLLIELCPDLLSSQFSFEQVSETVVQLLANRLEHEFNPLIFPFKLGQKQILLFEHSHFEMQLSTVVCVCYDAPIGLLFIELDICKSNESLDFRDRDPVHEFCEWGMD